MSQHDEFDRSLARWFETEPRPAATADVLDRALRATRQRRPRPTLFAALGSHWVGDSVGPASGVAKLGRAGLRTSMALLLLLLAIALVAGAVLVGGRLLQPAPVDLGIFEPVAGRIIYGDERGIWGVDPSAPADPATRVQLTSEAGSPLAWSSDGTRLLIMREGTLLVLHADGSETQVTVPRADAISPDLSRVAFGAPVGECCERMALYAVDIEGGPAEVLLESEDLKDLNVEEMTFSPDGTRIAYVVGRGDGDHRVWLMDADGTNAHRILANEVTLRGGHIRSLHGLAWSPAGDRIALELEGSVYTFATDGSGFTHIAYGSQPYWSPDGSRIAYTPCAENQSDACSGLAIADADGSNVREFLFGASGPWHPGKLHVAPSPSVEPTSVPSLDPTVTELPNGFIQARVAGFGAEKFLNDPSDGVPLLYATSSGGSYERGEFEQVLGIEWPYGWTAFKVRMYAGDTVVEQLFFTSLSGPGALDYQYDGFRTDIAPTTENGQPVGVPVTYFDGKVTMQEIHPWVGGKLIPEGARPTTDGGERIGWKRLVVKAVAWSCQRGRPGSAEAVAESIRSDPDLEATPPVAVSAGGANALMMDVRAAAGAGACGFTIPAGDRMRLYLIEAPEGSSIRVLGIAIIVPESSFARAVAPAPSMVDSVEFHAP